MSTAAPRIPAYTSLVLSGVRGAADQRERVVMRGKIDVPNSKAGPDGAGNTEPTPSPLVPMRPEGGSLVSISREVPERGHRPAQVLPIDAPTRGDLWSRNQLALSVLSHGRVDAQELIAILNGASIEDVLSLKKVS